MHVKVRLLAAYRRYLPEQHNGHGEFPFEVTPGATVGTVLSSLPLPSGEAFTFLVNGRHADPDRALQADDVLTVFPAVGGG